MRIRRIDAGLIAAGAGASASLPDIRDQHCSTFKTIRAQVGERLVRLPKGMDGRAPTARPQARFAAAPQRLLAIDRDAFPSQQDGQPLVSEAVTLPRHHRICFGRFADADDLRFAKLFPFRVTPSPMVARWLHLEAFSELRHRRDPVRYDTLLHHLVRAASGVHGRLSGAGTKSGF